MIVYLDTSSLVKLYVEEEDSAAIEDLVRASAVTATSLIAYAEARSAFARRWRENSFSDREYKRIVSVFGRQWEDYMRIRVSEEIVTWAGDLAEKHGLRGFDALHLSSAIALRKELSSEVLFSCSDRTLQAASQREDLAQPE